MRLLNASSIALLSIIASSAIACAQPHDRDDNSQGRRGPPAFSDIDLNSDGAVTLEEFMQKEVPNGDHQTIVNAIDSNSDGLITETELSEHKPPRRGGQRPD
jgi:hypothetical protein